MATVEAEVQEGERRGIRGNTDILLGVNQNACKQEPQSSSLKHELMWVHSMFRFHILVTRHPKTAFTFQLYHVTAICQN